MREKLQPPPLRVTEKALERSLESADVEPIENKETIKDESIDLDKALRRTTREKEVEEVPIPPIVRASFCLIKCEKCGKRFRSRKKLRRHEKSGTAPGKMMGTAMATMMVEVHPNHLPRERNRRHQRCSSDVSRHTRQHDVRNV